MPLIAIIQSRMTSERFPGKMLAPFLGKPVLAHVVERIQISKINLKIILATSNNYTDDPLAIYAKHLGIDVVRGSHEDVMSRFVLVLKNLSVMLFLESVAIVLYYFHYYLIKLPLFIISLNMI